MIDSNEIEIINFIDISNLNSFYHFEQYNQKIFFFLSEIEIFLVKDKNEQEDDEEEEEEDEENPTFIKLNEIKEEEEEGEQEEIISLNLSKRGIGSFITSKNEMKIFEI